MTRVLRDIDHSHAMTFTSLAFLICQSDHSVPNQIFKQCSCCNSCQNSMYNRCDVLYHTNTLEIPIPQIPEAAPATSFRPSRTTCCYRGLGHHCSFQIHLGRYRMGLPFPCGSISSFRYGGRVAGRSQLELRRRETLRCLFRLWSRCLS